MGVFVGFVGKHGCYLAGRSKAGTNVAKLVTQPKHFYLITEPLTGAWRSNRRTENSSEVSMIWARGHWVCLCQMTPQRVFCHAIELDGREQG